MRVILLTSTALLVAALAHGQTVFIKDLARIHTGTGSVVENASILVHNGKILAVGRDLNPRTIKNVIDGRGLEATPGIIDAHSHIAIEGGANEGTNVVTPEVRISDVINPADRGIYRALAGGATCAHVMHGSSNVIGGQNAVIKLKWESTVEDMLMVDAPGSVKFALGENPKRSNSRRRSTRPPRFPATRMGVEAVLRESFDGALAYKRQWEHWRKAVNAGGRAKPPRRSLRQEALVEILDGRLRIHCHSYRSDEILMMMRVAREYGIKIAVFHHALEAYRIAPEIAAHGAGVSTFADWWAFKMEAYDATPFNIRICERAGVLVSIKSDSSDYIRRLNVEAAKAVKYGGMGANDALKLVTLNSARQIGIDHRTGSIEMGKDGDIAIWSGDPLSSLSHVRYTIVEGKIEFDRQADLEKRKGPRRALHAGGNR